MAGPAYLPDGFVGWPIDFEWFAIKEFRGGIVGFPTGVGLHDLPDTFPAATKPPVWATKPAIPAAFKKLRRDILLFSPFIIPSFSIEPNEHVKSGTCVHK